MVRRHEPVSAHIESLTHDGRGIAAPAGKKVFIAGALPGEQVLFQRRRRRKNFDEGELLEIVEASPRRVPSPCEVYGVCGGCALQHMSAEDQRSIKLDALKDSLARIGRVQPSRWLAAVFDDSEEGAWGYRRRARLAVKHVHRKGRVLVGFRERFAPYVTDMHDCKIMAPPVNDMIDALSELIGGLSIRDRLPQIEVAVGENATVLVFRILDDLTQADREKLKHFGEQQCVSIALQTGGPSTVRPLEPHDATAPLSYTLPEFGLKLQFEATDFVQVNAAVNRLMVAQAVELLQIPAGGRVLDLFCGIGNFSLPIATIAGHVLGLEGEQEQVTRAHQNATANDIANCQFVVSDLASVEGDEEWLQRPWDRLLLDPARSGAADVVRHLQKIDPGRIVYVSCHPATLARDAQTIVEEYGYAFEAAGIIDMFPHTGHVESIAVFNKT